MYTIKTPILLSDVPGLFSGSEEPLVQQLMKTCILKDGQPIGEVGMKQLPLKDALRLSKQLVEAAGLGNES